MLCARCCTEHNTNLHQLSEVQPNPRALIPRNSRVSNNHHQLHQSVYNFKNFHKCSGCPDEDLDSVAPENLDLYETPNVEIEVEELFVPRMNPSEGIFEKYPHDSTLREIKADYVGSWHTDPFLLAIWNESWVFFPSGNDLFFPSQYECVYSINPNWTPTPIEDGL